MVKGNLTKFLRFTNEKEMNDLISAIEGNYKDEAFTILIKMIKEKRFAF